MRKPFLPLPGKLSQVWWEVKLRLCCDPAVWNCRLLSRPLGWSLTSFFEPVRFDVPLLGDVNRTLSLQLWRGFSFLSDSAHAYTGFAHCRQWVLGAVQIIYMCVLEEVNQNRGTSPNFLLPDHFFTFVTGSLRVAQAGLKFSLLPPRPSKC